MDTETIKAVLTPIILIALGVGGGEGYKHGEAAYHGVEKGEVSEMYSQAELRGRNISCTGDDLLVTENSKIKIYHLKCPSLDIKETQVDKQSGKKSVNWITTDNTTDISISFLPEAHAGIYIPEYNYFKTCFSGILPNGGYFDIIKDEYNQCFKINYDKMGRQVKESPTSCPLEC